jgi:hypothetical protein
MKLRSLSDLHLLQAKVIQAAEVAEQANKTNK